MQVQILDVANPFAQEQLDTYVGIINSIDTPFHLYINVDDLNRYNYVKLLIYSMGSKKQIIWGTYNLKGNKFEFESSCKFQLNQLRHFMQLWQSRGYEYIANAVADKIYTVISDDENRITYPEYKILKYAIAYLQHKISLQDFEKYDETNRLPGIIDKVGILNPENLNTKYNDLLFDDNNNYQPVRNDFVDWEELALYLEDLVQIVQEYETHINRVDIDRDILEKINGNIKLLQHIVEQFYSIIASNDYTSNSFYNSLQDCPEESTCKTSTSAEALPACGMYDFLETDYREFV